jgi:ketosteroid isomerase-like protein
MKPALSFPSPDDCARAFYEAFARRELDALMAMWAEDEEICCVHPGAMPLYGYAAVRAAWEAIFRSNADVRFDVREEHWAATVGMAVQNAIEWIYVGDEPQPRASVFATNVFLRQPQGWRMLSHVAAPIQSGFAAATPNVVIH